MAKVSPDERLKHVAMKVARASVHQKELQSLLSAFLASTPYTVAVERNTDRKPIYYVAAAEPVPDAIPLVAGDALQNLMSALDHLAYQLVCKDTGDQPPNPKWIYFPIADDQVTYDAKKTGKMQGAHADTLQAIDAVKPFKGGNDLLWKLYRLNNVEKHRLLLTVGSQAGGIHLGQLLAMQGAPSLPGAPPQFASDYAKALESMNLYLNPADKGFPLTAGFELYIGAVDEPPNPKLQFRFEVVLSEPGIVEGQPLMPLVSELAAEVARVVAALTPFLKRP